MGMIHVPDHLYIYRDTYINMEDLMSIPKNEQDQ